MALSLRKDDTVTVMTGKAKGKTGKILKILVDRDRALVEKVNMVKKNSKPSKANPQGGILEKEASIHISNLMFHCAKCAKGVRVGAKFMKDGKKVRVCKKCGEILDKV